LGGSRLIVIPRIVTSGSGIFISKDCTHKIPTLQVKCSDLTRRIFVGTIVPVMAGRPKKDKTARRATDVRIRVTDEERERFRKAAEAKGLDFSAWARMLLLEASKAHR
jgi:hypothetical protein